jgi:drug/metabolite transporter (DMT)-like permease
LTSPAHDGKPSTAARRWARVLLFVVPLLWSSNYIIARTAPDLITPHALAAWRWLLAALLMLPWVGLALWRQRAVLRREAGHLLVLGLLGMYVCGIGPYFAGQSTSANNIALIYAATPLAIAVASTFALGERMRAPQWLGLVLALFGLVFVVARGDLRSLAALQSARGDLWALGAAAAWTAYSVLLRRWPSALSPGVRLVAIIAGALVVLAPAAAVEAALWPTPPFSAAALGLVVAAAVLPGVLSYGAYSLLQRELGASRTALMLYLAPLYAALLAWLLLGERPGWYHAVGAALILPSIWLATRR